MKEIKEEIKREMVETHIHYQAVDGTFFDDKEECRKYEKSALGMMRALVKPLMSEPKDAWTTMGGLDNHQVVAVSIPDEKAVETIIHWLFLECPYYLQDSHKERKEEVVNTIRQAFENSDFIVVGVNCDGDYYFINSHANLVANLDNLRAGLGL